MKTTVHHIALIVSSEESLQFYRLLGFTEFFRLVRDYDIVVLMCCGSVELEFFIDSRHTRNNGIEPIGLRHFALKVDRLDETIERLKKNGLHVGDVALDWRKQRYCNLKDNDGIVVELHE